jgi:YHS domain-containing protein
MIKSIKLLGLLAFIFSSISLYSQDLNALRKKHFNLEKSIAIQGFDPVSYFTAAKAIKGNKQYAYNYGNAIYYFSSSTNLELFKASPNKYEPQFGGWCAYAMGNTGEKVEIDPKTFKIIGGKLYLFYHTLFNNTLDTWNKSESTLLSQANNNWKKIFK